jgi:pterin-4a-carbinolamine dehydratase
MALEATENSKDSQSFEFQKSHRKSFAQNMDFVAAIGYNFSKLRHRTEMSVKYNTRRLINLCHA